MGIYSMLPVIQIILAVLLTVSVLLQQSEAGAGAAFGGSSDSVSTWRTRRGFEKFLFFFTIVIAILFIAAAILTLKIQ